MTKDDLTEVELLVLDYLANNGEKPPTMSRVARNIGVTFSHLSKTINTMEVEHGWVERKMDQGDRRKILLSISKKGRAVLSKAQEEERERMRMIIPKLRTEEKDTVFQSIAVFNRILNEMNA
jgi:DNA-binding MarR family transcriptional regulator